MSDEIVERIELKGIVYCMAGKIDIDDMPLEVLIAQAFEAEIDELGLIRKNGALGRARVIVEVIE